MISALRSVLDNNGNSGGGGAPKRLPARRLLPILAVLGNLVLAVLLMPTAHAQATGNTTIQPDCLIPFTFTAAGNFPATNVTGGAGDNRTKGCAAWTLMYQNTGMTSVSVTLQSGSSVSTTVSYGAFAGTISTGFVNPIVSDTGGSLQATNSTADISWVRVHVAATGTGTLTGVLYGFRNSSAAVNTAPASGCPAGTLGAVQFYLTSVLCGGDATVVFENITALTVPSAPVITQGGTPGATSYTYKVALNNAVGPGVFSSGTTTTTGPAALDGTNYNTISSPTCPTGVTTYSVQATRGLLLPLGTCGVAYNDTGVKTDFVDHSAVDYSTGIYDGKRLVVADQGDDVRYQTYFGSAPSAFSASIYDISFLDLSYHVTAHAGSFDGSGANALQTFIAEQTSGVLSPKAVATESYSTVTGQFPTGQFSLAGASGTNNIGGATAYVAELVALSSGHISGIATGFYMFDGLLNSSGTIDEIQGFNCDPLSAGTNRNSCYHSDVNAASSTWALYFAGTAASHFGGEVEIIGALNVLPTFLSDTGSVSPGVSAGGDFEVATGSTGNFTNVLAGNFDVGNFSSGTVTNLIVVRIEESFNAGGGIVTNNYGLLIGDQSAGSSNWAIKTGLGLVEHDDVLYLAGNVVNPFQQAKNTQTATAPGAAKCDLRWIAGTIGSSGKIVAACGTSATEVTIADNVGTGL